MKTMSIYLLSTSFSWVEEDNLRIEDLQENKAIQHVLNDNDDEYFTPKIQKTTKENLSKSNVPEYELEKQSFYDVSSFPSNYDSHNVAENYSKHFDVRYICQICDQTFPHKDQLEQHQWIDHMNYPFSIITMSSNSSQSEPFTEELDALTCKVCKIRFLEKRSLEKHKCIIHELNPYSSMHFPPIQTHSPSNMRFCCRICGKIILKRGNLKQHAIAHLRRNEKSPPSYCCEICPETFGKKLDLRRHIKLNHIKEQISMKKSSKSKRDLSLHETNSPPTRNYYCELCPEIFGKKSALNKHAKMNHLKEQISKEKSSKSKRSLKHETKDTCKKSEEGPYKCTTCEKSYTTKGSLKYHTLVHAGIKEYSCDICKRSFTHKGNLKTHLRTHTGEKPYKCSVCGKCFAIISTMKIHMNIHTGLRPYSCDVCKKTFTQSTSLTLHKRVHSGEKPFKCDICGKCFSQSGSLRVHKRVHTGEKPYLCTLCGHGFSQLTGLNLHKKTHDRVSCNLCSKSFANREKLMKHEELHDIDKKES